MTFHTNPGAEITNNPRARLSHARHICKAPNGYIEVYSQMSPAPGDVPAAHSAYARAFKGWVVTTEEVWEL